MVAIKAYFDGKHFVPLDEMEFKPRQPAIIVIEEEASSERKASCRGRASAYAKPELIQLEEEFVASAFSGR